MTTNESRSIALTDLPLLRRLSSQGIVLDTEMRVTQSFYGVPVSHLISLLFNRGIYTYLARNDQHQVIGQFRYRADDVNAHMLCLAPALEQVDDSLWLTILDGMTREAGKVGAHTLLAEVDAQSSLFEIFRQARFACYMRQTIWRHDAVIADPTLHLSAENSNDQIGIMSLICHTIPTLQQGIATPSVETDGLVYRRNQQVEAYIAYTEGKAGIYILPYIHPNVAHLAKDIIISAIANIPSTQRLPIYITVRSYQAWLEQTMHDLNFTSVVEQAVMVRQIAAGVRHIAFSHTKHSKQESAQRVTPPYWSSAQPLDED
jgi:hypothetical protein